MTDIAETEKRLRSKLESNISLTSDDIAWTIVNVDQLKKVGWVVYEDVGYLGLKSIATECKSSFWGSQIFYILKKEFFDEIAESHFSKRLSIPTIAYYEGKIKKTCGLTTKNFGQYLVSRKFSIHSNTNIHFQEHSGVGWNGPKLYKAPEGEAYGMEIETVFEGRDQNASLEKKLNFCDFIESKYPSWICERDGSLEDGVKSVNKNHLVHSSLELVSPPLDYNSLISSLEEIVPIAKELGAQGKKCGEFFAIHITSNMPQGPAAAAKFAKTVNKLDYRKFWLTASSRPDSSAFSGDSGKAYCKFTDGLDEYTISDVMKTLGGGHHYHAVFCRSQKAVELRIFQTRINLNYVKAITELNKLLYKFSIGSQSDWIEFVKKEASRNLINYLDTVHAFSANINYE